MKGGERKDRKGQRSLNSQGDPRCAVSSRLALTQTDGDPPPKCHTGGGACGEPPW